MRELRLPLSRKNPFGGLEADLAGLRLALAAGDGAGGTARVPTPAPGTALAVLGDIFGLSPAARRVLLLAVGAELDTAVAARLAALRGLAGEARPDVATALALVPEGGWEALAPDAPLRRWRLLEAQGRGPRLRLELVVDERTLWFLTGVGGIDPRLAPLLRPPPARDPSPAEAALAERLGAAWAGDGEWPVLVVAGRDGIALLAVAAAAAARAGLATLAIEARDLPADPASLGEMALLLDREVALAGAALAVEGAGAGAAGLADRMLGPVALLGPDPPPPARRARLLAAIEPEGRAGRRLLWARALGEAGEPLGSGLDRLAEQFALDRAGVEAAVATAGAATGDASFDALWAAARGQARRGLDGLARRVPAAAGWDDLVLPPDRIAQLRELSHHVREAWRVRGAWGWEARGGRGLGAAALFAGGSGTGKTMAAEVLARDLGLDLYAVDLAQVSSKWIGETEKNLERVFAAAEDGGAVLLFDEADALFGKRSEVRDSHDRHANLEVSYLLQRMEAYRGLAILTTNQKGALDPAFLRRLRAVVTFPFPDQAARAAIWARAFPPETPQEGLDPQRLGRLSLAGGSIRSVALNATVLAAAEGGPVRPVHVLRAARREYGKIEKPMTAAETRGLG